MSRLTPKWRPALWMVLGGALIATLALSLAGLVALRYLGPQIGFRRAALVLALAIAAATCGLGFLLVRLLLRPISLLSQRSAALGQGQVLITPLDHYGTQELRDLAQRMMSMAAALQNREATIRSFTDHVTHELKSPVSAIRAAAELLADGSALGSGDARLVQQIIGAAGQMQGQLDALRQVAAAREPTHHGRVRLDTLLPGLAADHPSLTLNCTGDGVDLPLSAAGLRIVLAHLLGNAASHGATEVALDVAADRPTLTVRDNGSGISAGNSPQIFAPFFTTRRDNGGTGMGLTIIDNLLRAHGATITLSPAYAPGAAFEIRFDPVPPEAD